MKFHVAESRLFFDDFMKVRNISDFLKLTVLCIHISIRNWLFREFIFCLRVCSFDISELMTDFLTFPNWSFSGLRFQTGDPMETEVEKITVDTAFDLLERKDSKDFKWTVSLGDPDWPKDILILSLYEEDDDKEMVWSQYGRIDAVRRSVNSPSRSVLIMTSWTESVDVWELDPKKFLGRAAKCHVRADIDGVVSKLKKNASEKDWPSVRLDSIREFFGRFRFFEFRQFCSKFEIRFHDRTSRI